MDVGGTRIAVHDSGGRGVPIVFLHGSAISSRAFERQFRGALPRAFRVVAIDFPGHGESERAADPGALYSIPAFANLVAEVATRLDAATGVFVGWSLGGHVLLEAASTLGEARGFCIFGAPPLAGPDAMGDAFLSHPAVPDLFKENLSDEEIRVRVSACVRPDAPLPDLFVDEVRRSDPRFRSALLESFSGVGFRDELEIVRTLDRPLAVFHGSHEQVVNAGYLAATCMPTLWRTRVQLIDAAGHSPQWEAPDAFDALLASFARDVTA